MEPFSALSGWPTCGVPPILASPSAGMLAVIVSSSRIVMVLVPKAVPSRSPVTVSVRMPSAVSFPAAVTVTGGNEPVSAGRTTWWPAAFGSPSTGLTL